VAGREAAHDAARTLQRQDAQSCSRNQIQRTYDRVDEAYGAPLANAVEGVVGKAGLHRYRVPDPPRPVIAARYLQIVDCDATYSPDNKSGLPIYLTRRDERCFMNLVISGYFVRQAPRTDPGFLRHVCDASGNAYH
jgi:hypothetical protein